MSHQRHQHYWQRFLLPDEQVLHTFGVSRLYLVLFFLVPALVVLGVGVGVTLTTGILGALFLLAGFGMFMPLIFMWFFVHYAVTDRRILSRSGILGKYMVSVDFSTITDIAIREPFWERILTGSGTIEINTAGSHDVELVMQHVAAPHDRRHDVYKHAQQSRNGGDGKQGSTA